MYTSRTPARLAARTFSLMPPTGSTRPLSVISPVMATRSRTGRRVSAESSTVAIVTPAEGPSLGNGPSRDVNVDVVVLKEVRIDPVIPGVASDPGQRRLHRLLHHLAHVSG